MARKIKNAKIGVAQVAAPEVVADQADMPAVAREPRDMLEFLGLAAEIAQDTVYVRNSRWSGATEDFPHDPELRTVEKYFPQAKGGAIYVDGPCSVKDNRTVAQFKRKAAALLARGLRYVYIVRNERDEDPSADDVLAQLGGARGVA